MRRNLPAFAYRTSVTTQKKFIMCLSAFDGIAPQNAYIKRRDHMLFFFFIIWLRIIPSLGNYIDFTKITDLHVMFAKNKHTVASRARVLCIKYIF